MQVSHAFNQSRIGLIETVVLCLFNAGTTRFEIAYTVFFEGAQEFYPFNETSDFYSEMSDIPEGMLDGKRLRIHVRGYDITNTFVEDTVNVTADSSPPIIEDLWLTRGDKVNLTVHNLLELSQLT